MARRPRIQTVFDYSYDGVMRSFEDSLQRLGVNRVDVLLIHDLDPSDHNPATLNAYLTQLKTSGWKALAELREAGVIGGIGGGIQLDGIVAALSRPLRHGLLPARDALHAARAGRSRERVPRCEERGVGIVVGAATIPAFSRPAPFRAPCTIMRPPAPRSWSGWGRSRRCAPATRSRFPPPRCNFRSAIRSSPRSFPARVAGAQVEKNVAAFRHPIPADFWAELKHEKLIRAEAPTPA